MPRDLQKIFVQMRIVTSRWMSSGRIFMLERWCSAITIFQARGSLPELGFSRVRISQHSPKRYTNICASNVLRSRLRVASCPHRYQRVNDCSQDKAAPGQAYRGKLTIFREHEPECNSGLETLPWLHGLDAPAAAGSTGASREPLIQLHTTDVVSWQYRK